LPGPLRERLYANGPLEDLKADKGASYRAVHQVDVSDLGAQVAVPHQPDNVRDVREVAGVKVNMAFIGSCTNARLEDLHVAAAVLRGRKLAPGVRLIVAASSRT